jgi:RNA polymerase sigma factor (sigma-70 family)
VSPPTSLADLIAAERPTILRTAERITGNRADAEDVAQSLWLRVQGIEDEAAIAQPRAYLHRLIRNLSLDLLRTRHRRERLATEIEQLVSGIDEAPGQERIVGSLVLLRRVRAAAEALPEPTRTIFGLNRFERVTHREIARRLGISTTTVENHIRRALEVLASARDGSAG